MNDVGLYILPWREIAETRLRQLTSPQSTCRGDRYTWLFPLVDLTHSTLQPMKRIRRFFGPSHRPNTPGRTPQITPAHPVGYQTLSEGTEPIIAE